MSAILPREAEAGVLAAEDPRLELRLAFWAPLFATLALDLITKSIAVATLVFWDAPRPVVGDVLRFALAYNPGVAFGWHVGEASRVVFSVLASVVLFALYRLYRATAAGDTPRALALGLLCGGALGNLLDRLRSARGVVDFIDIGIGDARWWTFNLADVGVAIGACLLIRILWREEEATDTSSRNAS